MNAKKVPGTFSGSGPGTAAPKRFLTPFLCAGLMLAVVAGAAALRLASLDNRPMHCDEAVHAVKLGRLLAHDGYIYNPREYHGPSLNFLTLPIARLGCASQLSDLTETRLRLIPAIFGIALVGLVWPIRRELGLPAALCAAVLTAVSPAMVFFSRYYIQEMLLVCFTFAAIVALWRYARAEAIPGRFSYAWLVMLGVCVGMMHASKETCVIALAAIVPAAALTIRIKGTRLFPRSLLWAALIVLPTAAAVSALFFSSFFDNPRGVLDSLTTYFVYLGRASGEGSAGRHYQPWHYYLENLFWWRRGGGPVFSEAAIAVLALVGLIAAAWGKGVKPAVLPMARFLAVYTLLMTVVYSALPYKTPWCALGLLHGMILLAGVGMVVLVRAAPGYALKAVAIALLATATAHLTWQAHRASFVAYEDPNNPYVYAHTTSDVPLLARRIKEIAAVHPDGPAMHVQVICPDDDHWPLPWYLRDFSRVGWPSKMPRGPAAPLIITQPAMKDAVLDYVYVKQPPGQRPLRQSVDKPDGTDWKIRPNVPLLVIVRRDLLEDYRAAQAETHKAAQRR